MPRVLRSIVCHLFGVTISYRHTCSDSVTTKCIINISPGLAVVVSMRLVGMLVIILLIVFFIKFYFRKRKQKVVNVNVTFNKAATNESGIYTTAVELPLSPICESAVEVESIRNLQRDPELISTEINEAYQSKKEFIPISQNEAYEGIQAVRARGPIFFISELSLYTCELSGVCAVHILIF